MYIDSGMMMFHLSCIELHQIYVSVPVVEKLAAGLIYLVSKLRGTDFNTLFEVYSPATVKISLYKSNNCVLIVGCLIKKKPK